MKHGVAFRKLSRPTAHRMLMLRNMVTSLFEHEQIKTTLPKAREAARMAEKIITMGKKGDRGAQDRAASLLLKPELLPKLFGTFAQRYARREGGYTRIHKFGNRIGDNAPHAILELVDNPRDLRYEITARAIGWELLKNKLKRHTPEDIVNSGHRDTHEFLDKEKRVEVDSHKGLLRPKTRWNLQKVLRFRKPEASLDMSQKVSYYMDHLLATPTLSEQPRNMAGFAAPGETRSALQLARGALGHQRPPSNQPVLTRRTLFRKK